MEKDKIYHFIVSYLIVVVGTMILKGVGIEPDRSVALASLLAFAAGVGKELFDKYVRKTTFDKMDLFADICGLMLATLTIILV